MANPDDTTDRKQRGDNRRSSARWRSRTLADGTIRSGASSDDSFLGSTIDLSANGACVRTYEALTDGMRVALRLRLPEGDLETLATVTHVTLDSVGCSLAGVEFDPLSIESGALLATHLAGVVPGANGYASRGPNGEADKDVELRTV